MTFTPLDGTRVLDLSRYLPGPFMTRILSDLGAEVIKVEPPMGEGMRWMPPHLHGAGVTFGSLHVDKESLAIDLKKPEGVAYLKALAAECDVLVEAFRPGKMAALGLGFEDLQSINPRLIVCSLSGYGQTGPNAQTAGHDLNYLADAGVLALFGPADGPPQVPGTQIADIGGGSLPAAIAVLAALLERQSTGRGRHLDISLAHGAAAFGATAFPAAAALGAPAEPRGGGMLTGGAPGCRCYETADGRYLALAGLEPHFFSTLCTLAERPDLAPHSYAVGAEGERVIGELEALFRSKSLAEWLELTAGHDVCLNEVRVPNRVLDDPDYARVVHDVDGLLALSAGLGAQTRSPTKPPSKLGADAPAVTERLRIDKAVVEAAKASGALLWPEED